MPRAGAPGRRRAVLLLLAIVGATYLAATFHDSPALFGAVGQEQQPPTELDAQLVNRLAAARAAAAEHGIEIVITSGWRSAADQQRLVDDAVATHGSLAAAQRWVLPPETSAHVWGRAIDIRPQSARDWLAKHGYQFGLCPVYDNEPWHFEPVTDPGEPCPRTYRDAAHGWS